MRIRKSLGISIIEFLTHKKMGRRNIHYSLTHSYDILVHTLWDICDATVLISTKAKKKKKKKGENQADSIFPSTEQAHKMNENENKSAPHKHINTHTMDASVLLDLLCLSAYSVELFRHLSFCVAFIRGAKSLWFFFQMFSNIFPIHALSGHLIYTPNGESYSLIV